MTYFRFVCAASIEQKVLELQNKKKQLASDVLDGYVRPLHGISIQRVATFTAIRFRAVRSKKNKLTLADLKFLFELDPPATKTTRAKPATSQQPPPPRFQPASQLLPATQDIVTLD